MDTNTNEYDELIKDHERLLQYLADRIEEMLRTLGDDEEFCNKDIDTTKQYVENIEKKFNEKIQELKDKLEKIRIDNKNISEQNKKQFNDRIQEVNDLFTNEKYDEAWKKFKDYEKSFEQRTTVIQHIPKLNMNETDIQQYFSSDYKSNKSSPIQSTNVISSTIIIKSNDDIQNSVDDNQKTKKERLREEKIIDTVHFDKDNEEFNDEKTEQYVDNSQFGIRSKRPENQQIIINGAITNNTKSPITTIPTRAPIPFSTRLRPTSNNTNLPFSGRNISETQNTRVNNEQRQSPRSNITLIINPVSDYQHKKNIFLLMTCNTRYIVLFESQLNRLDRWSLGAIERGSQTVSSLDWHDGLIISMGYMGNNNIYMFTEREFFIYSISTRRKLQTRILPHGNDDGFEINNSSLNEYQRGIGTVDDKFMYHIYLNRSSHWTLSKTSLDTLSRMHNYDLTLTFPDVLRFIHLCISEKTINFLVQMNDLSYAVVFWSINKSISSIILPGAKQPLTIYSAFIQSLKCEVFFINDPSNDILHILTIEKYLQSYPIIAHAICYVVDKHELMIVTNTHISSINLNQQNFFS